MAGFISPDRRALIVGPLLAVPFVALNALVSSGVAPVRAFFHDVVSADVLSTNPLGFFVFVAAIGLVVAGAITTLRHAIARNDAGRLRSHLGNLAVGGILLALAMIVVGGLGAEAYQCELLGVANCD